MGTETTRQQGYQQEPQEGLPGKGTEWGEGDVVCAIREGFLGEAESAEATARM